jgi:AcrR family transcriptional regulator
MAMGRPRAFDTEQALDRALDVFLRQGYEGASLAALTAAMGINPPSLYACFGNKEGLFRATLDRYERTRGASMAEALARPTAREAVEHLLRSSAKYQTDPDSPPGCLLVQAALTCSGQGEGIKGELGTRRAAAETALRERFRRARAEGDLPDDADPAALARFVTTTINGMAVSAAGGASRAELMQVIDLALRAWPAPAKARKRSGRAARTVR